MSRAVAVVVLVNGFDFYCPRWGGVVLVSDGVESIAYANDFKIIVVLVTFQPLCVFFRAKPLKEIVNCSLVILFGDSL